MKYTCTQYMNFSMSLFVVLLGLINKHQRRNQKLGKQGSIQILRASSDDFTEYRDMVSRHSVTCVWKRSDSISWTVRYLANQRYINVDTRRSHHENLKQSLYLITLLFCCLNTEKNNENDCSIKRKKY